MFTQHRSHFSEFLRSSAVVSSSFLTATFSFLRLFNPYNARAKETHTGVSLNDIKIDRYGRTVVKHQKIGISDVASGDYVQDEWCPVEDPSKCTLKQCGCPPPDQQCNCPPPDQQCNCPPPDQQCNCPPPDQQCQCPSSPNQICDCPDLVCPCPDPPPAPWPVPDLVCPCPTPPPPPPVPDLVC